MSIPKEFNEDYAKYVEQWSDESLPITKHEECAYRAGWQDCYYRFVGSKKQPSKSSNNE